MTTEPIVLPGDVPGLLRRGAPIVALRAVVLHVAGRA
jgi:hypothetical protein